MGNNPVGKKVNTPKVNTWVFTFLRKYSGCLKVNTFLLLALGFYLNPNGASIVVVATFLCASALFSVSK